MARYRPCGGRWNHIFASRPKRRTWSVLGATGRHL